MQIITLTTLDDAVVTLVSQNICSMLETRDHTGTVITLTNDQEITVKESMLEIAQQMQSAVKF